MRPQLISTGLRLAAVSVWVSSVLLAAAPAAHASDLDHDDDTLWHARVAGTLGRGLLVRSGPGQHHTVQVTLPEGTRVRVIAGPEADAGGRSWYVVTGYDRAGGRGWSAAEYLQRMDPGEAELTVAGGAAVGRTFVARMTAYSYQTTGGGAHGSITRSGTQVRWGTVAVDPRVIPLGTRLMIEGFDTVFVAEDTGGGVQGEHIDIFFPDYAAAVRFGVQYRTVTILN